MQTKAGLETRATTAENLRQIIHGQELDAVNVYFKEDVDNVDPSAICEGVSVAAFNYLDDDEAGPINLRFCRSWLTDVS